MVNIGNMCSLAALARGCRPAAGADKPCCLCWCCCCSCSCLAVRGSEGGPGKKPPAGPQEPLLNEGDAPPTLEEIQSWGQSFDRLMRSAAGRKVFRDFLRGEYSEENIMFWLACEELKRETDPDAVEEKARFIYEDYISILSPKEVSLDSRVREVVNRNMVEPTPHTFDEAQLQIYTLMHRDSYPRFVNSPLYKALARLSSAEGGAGGAGGAGSAAAAGATAPASAAVSPQ
ncbi:regulator of G protein signaling double hit isoform X2 [Anticarsia gemmatalis]|uniref:regulator of G protein signaling double hit isoform X2 n=1 Tax=Anticarsia gemmatalis TaxID=129554 RepID=UPI003F75BAC9